MIRSLIILCSTIFCANLYAYPITSFNDIAKSLEMGYDVKAIIHFSKCVALDGTKAPNVIGRINFDVYNQYQLQDGQETIATSYTMMTEHRTHGLIKAYTRLRVYRHKKADVHVAYYDHNNALKESHDYQCPLDDKAIVLFGKA